jgi:hypothetical protein
MAFKLGSKIAVAPLALGATGLSAATCFVLTVLNMDKSNVGYVMVGFGLCAGFLQWWYCRQEIAKGAMVSRNSIAGQFYGLVIFTGFCSAPAIIVGRVLTGQKIL